jgi:hypothetical protein
MKDYAQEILRTLTYLEKSPPLEELQQRYPEDWDLAERELAAAIRDKDKARLDQLMRPLDAMPKRHTRQQPVSKQEARDLQHKLIRQRMSAIAIERYLKGSLADPKAAHLGFADRLLLRLIFFRAGWRRKLVSPFLFRHLWPRVKRKNLLMPMAEAHGIYNFFSSTLLTGLAREIGNAKCLEIAAGDGFLTRVLQQRGVDIRATDDQSWAGKGIAFDGIEKLDAAAALTAHQPEIVLCAWPPARNNFEQHVFGTPSVRRYILIASEHRNLAGNWPLYQAVTDFGIEKNTELGRHLYPPEAGGAVYIFDRRQPR